MGPSIRLLLPSESNGVVLQTVNTILPQICSKVQSNGTDRWDFWVNNDSLIGGQYQGEGRPIYSHFSRLSLEPHERIIFQEEFGFTPEWEWHSDAGCNKQEDHQILGQWITWLTNHLGGIVDFYGALLPPLPESMYKGFWLWEEASWSDIAPYFEPMVGEIPGKIISIPYLCGEAESRTWVHHVADVEFMKAWLKHPRFHLVK